MPAGLGACSGLGSGELAIPKALPGPTGDGCGNIDGEGLTPPDGGREGGEAREKEEVAGLEPYPCCVWGCTCQVRLRNQM